MCGVGWDGMGWDGMVWDGTVCLRIGCVVEWDGVRWDGVGYTTAKQLCKSTPLLGMSFVLEPANNLKWIIYYDPHARASHQCDEQDGRAHMRGPFQGVAADDADLRLILSDVCSAGFPQASVDISHNMCHAECYHHVLCQHLASTAHPALQNHEPEVF